MFRADARETGAHAPALTPPPQRSSRIAHPAQGWWRPLPVARVRDQARAQNRRRRPEGDTHLLDEGQCRVSVKRGEIHGRAGCVEGNVHAPETAGPPDRVPHEARVRHRVPGPLRDADAEPVQGGCAARFSAPRWCPRWATAHARARGRFGDTPRPAAARTPTASRPAGRRSRASPAGRCPPARSARTR